MPSMLATPISLVSCGLRRRIVDAATLGHARELSSGPWMTSIPSFALRPHTVTVAAAMTGQRWRPRQSAAGSRVTPCTWPATPSGPSVA